MALHQIRRVQVVPAAIGKCWEFFSDPRNLSKITPPGLDFRVTSDVPSAIRPGLLIEYRVRPLFGLALTWVSEITHVEKGRYFVDEQRIGPYRIWHHEHFFHELEDGRTEITDLVHYAPPFGWIGELFRPLLVVPALEKIFAFREKAVREQFGG
jgi:ligand-binding SRPBCC domain-containing protein